MARMESLGFSLSLVMAAVLLLSTLAPFSGGSRADRSGLAHAEAGADRAVA